MLCFILTEKLFNNTKKKKVYLHVQKEKGSN